ncbi:hypothetical protein T310_2681 [Rasamsonia emersonii CBS 393.64]|uniref:Uncharacterized protein n=1 Tax=Rasamsonia emersonii (strain ATCC 16479 / CBS 393.64 / IMI 116815) TaxID=1408163 RepID=A0A0F4YYE9_RASE3|nr:hypothetical protein T310_2681 [Rasamsonia emersonii CBS 393.64]KKA23322.1 hypothetical protein T310_2681 [Rasamsonia emersonii CBS 393.64]
MDYDHCNLMMRSHLIDLWIVFELRHYYFTKTSDLVTADWQQAVPQQLQPWLRILWTESLDSLNTSQSQLYSSSGTPVTSRAVRSTEECRQLRSSQSRRVERRSTVYRTRLGAGGRSRTLAPGTRPTEQREAQGPASAAVPSARSTGHQGHAVGADLIFEPASLPGQSESCWWRGPTDREGLPSCAALAGATLPGEVGPEYCCGRCTATGWQVPGLEQSQTAVLSRRPSSPAGPDPGVLSQRAGQHMPR